MGTLLTLLIGMFIGWNLPQPDWARTIQDKAIHLGNQLISSAYVTHRAVSGTIRPKVTGSIRK